VGESVLRFLKCVCVCCLGVVHAPVQSTRRTLPSFRVHRSSQHAKNRKREQWERNKQGEISKGIRSPGGTKQKVRNLSK